MALMPRYRFTRGHDIQNQITVDQFQNVPPEGSRSQDATHASLIFYPDIGEGIELGTFKNTRNGLHAEDDVIQSIMKNLKLFSRDGENDLVLSVSRSPCQRCCGTLLNFFSGLQDGYSFRLTLIVRGLYAPRGGSQETLADSQHSLNMLGLAGIRVSGDVRGTRYEAQ